MKFSKTIRSNANLYADMLFMLSLMASYGVRFDDSPMCVQFYLLSVYARVGSAMYTIFQINLYQSSTVFYSPTEYLLGFNVYSYISLKLVILDLLVGNCHSCHRMLIMM